jgi:cephalosporin-C deacetylase-like acetyl esterase
MSIWTAEIKELEKLYEFLKGQLPDLEKELGQLIHFDDPNVILLYSRRCLEVIITDLCECELKRPRKTEPLKGIIDKLQKEEKVPSHIIASMHGLNELSTYGTHPKDFDPEQVKPVLNNLDIIIKWYLKYKDFHIPGKQKQEVQADNIKLGKGRKFSLSVKSGILIPGILITIFILGTLIILLNRYSKIKWAKEKALAEIEQLINKENITAAFSLVQKAGKYISKEPKFQELSSLVTSDLTILTDPTGADVYIREYLDIKGKWKKLGRTPIESAKIPGGSVFWGANSFYLTRIEKPGYEDVLAMTSTLPGLFRTVTKDTLYRKLFIQGTIPPDMVYVEGFGEEVISDFYKEKHGFFIDRYEVTNKKFKEFIDNGGYGNPVYWKNEFIKDGKKLTWHEAMAEFKDKTGRPGPATWEAGDFPDGMDNYPVSGISWYEAAAYAEYTGKSLPTASHWDSGAGNNFLNLTFYSKLMSISNFTSRDPEPVGKHQGVTRFGAYDMAGNVREWCWNDAPVGHIICGGAWDDASYLFYEWSQLPAFDRSPKNGLRCVQYIDREKIPGSAFQPIEYSEETDFSKITPVEDNIFAIYKSRFLYDKTDLNEKVEEKDNSNEDWTVEKISFNAAYAKEKVIAYLFLPKNSSPPFQTLIFYPGLNALAERDLLKSIETKWLTDYLLKSGRAVLCPVYKGTFERIDDQEPVVSEGRQLTDWIIKWVKDFSRSVDYLETRSDIDHDRIGYYGSSWGGYMGAIIPALEERLKVNILIVGGLLDRSPDIDMVSFASRIKIPTLMLNGKYDYTFPYEKSVLPFFDLLGTTKKDLKLYNTDHYVPRNEMIKEVLNWCDNYLGPVKLKSQ